MIYMATQVNRALLSKHTTVTHITETNSEFMMMILLLSPLAKLIMV